MLARGLFLGLYALSGVAALICQVAWTKLLTLQMGHTVAAASTVLAAFMGGLAAGAAIGGRAATRLPPLRALRVYALLEIAIGLAALLLPAALSSLRPVLSWSYANGEGGAWFGVTRLISSLVLLAVPAAAMGATFPVAARWMISRAARAGSEAGGLYAANTLGAASGALLAGFVLLPTFGLWRTTLLGAALNLTVAGGAFLLARLARGADFNRSPSSTAVASNPKDPTGTSSKRWQRLKGVARRDQEPMIGRPGLAALALGISGFVALVYEVAWTRILSMILGPTTYAFSAMLVAFIGGLACGSALGAWLAARLRRPAFWLGLTLIATALGGFGSIALVGRLPLIVAAAVADPDAQFRSIVGLQSSLAAAFLVPMTLALGAAFPLAIAVAARDTDRLPLDIGLVYSVNTMGAIGGALAGGFVLLPLLGLQTTTLAAGVMALAGGALVIAFSGVGILGSGIGLVATGLGIAAVLMFPSWDRELLSSGAYKYAPYIREPDVLSALKAGTLLYYQEGAAGTISVKRVAGTLSLAIDGKVDASNAGDMLTQKLLAHLPLLLHPNPKQVAIIGLGSGVTLGSALRHPVARVDLIEISPEVVEASSYFATENHDALGDPRAHLVLGDGRSHLRLADRAYDVIVSEPSNPWMAGVAALFTREFFEAARARLAPGGLLCQWAHTYDMADADLRSVAATFRSVFPHGTIWLVGEGDVLFIASIGEIAPHLAEIARGWDRPGVAADLADVSVRDPFSLFSLMVAGEEGLARYSAGGLVQTDDRTALEYSGPRSIYGRQPNVNAATLRTLATETELPLPVRQALASAGAPEWRNRGQMQLHAEAYGTAYEDFARAVARDPSDRVALEGLTEAAGGAARDEEALKLLRDLAAGNPANAAVSIAASRLLASRGAFDEAMGAAATALAVEPENPEAREQIAAILADLNASDRLEPLVAEMQRLHPDREGSLYYAATLQYLQGHFQEAARLAEEVVKKNPRHARAHNLRGAAYASLGQPEQAQRALLASARANPKDPATYTNLGVAALQAGNLEEATDFFAEALTIDPTAPPALGGLADALERQGETARAARLRAQSRTAR